MEQMTDYWSVRNTQYTHTPSLPLFVFPPSLSISMYPYVP